MAGFLDVRRMRRSAHLISVWVAAGCSGGAGGGVAGEWGDRMGRARGRGWGCCVWMVTSSNERAIRFYERMGFGRKVGRMEPYPNDQGLVEIEMVRLIS